MEPIINNGKTIRIDTGRVNQPVVETLRSQWQVNASLFSDQYIQALNFVNRYVENSRKIRGEGTLYTEYPNNIIAFVGDRGSGKTSCMCSVARLLTSGDWQELEGYEQIKHTAFAGIDMIDPSYFDEQHNIVATMVAKLYKSFRSIIEVGSDNSFDSEEHDHLIDAFTRAQHSMQCLLNKEDDNQYLDDDVETLSELSKAVDLKNDVDNLVKTYMRFIKKPEGILVLSIDDIDLNISEADTMAEQIRKYLVLPNIIILLAAKLDQLTTIKNLHYVEKYKELIQRKLLDFSVVEDMTGQFLTKFAPHDQRIYMPSAEYYLQSGVEIDGDTMNGSPVQQAIPELIFRKTRYLFYNSAQEASHIVPRNLRKLCQLLSMLKSMDEYDEDNGGKRSQTAFKNYLFVTWVQDNLTPEDRKWTERVLAGWKNEQLNRITLDVLQEKYGKWINDTIVHKDEDRYNINKVDLPSELEQLLDSRNLEYNISTGDIFSLISNLKVAFESHSDQCFFFIITSIYSMALYEAYNQITDEMDDVVRRVDEEEKKEKLVLLFDPFADERVEGYHKIVGGRFYNYRLSPIMPRERVSSGQFVSRSDRMISFHPLLKLIDECVEEWKDEATMDAEKREALKTRIRMAEFFMLCTIRNISTQHQRGNPDYYEPTFRRSDNVYYSGEYAKTRLLYFDLGAFFHNVTCMDKCYARFGKSGINFLAKCALEKGYDVTIGEGEGEKKEHHFMSMFASFRSQSKGRRPGYNRKHAWQSWASLRNGEIVYDLNQRLRTKCLRAIESSNLAFLRLYFRALSDYRIHTYDMNDDESSYLSIDFEYAEAISRLLSNNTEAFKALFDSIYTINTITVEAKGPAKMDLNNIDPSRLVNKSEMLKRRKEEGNRSETVKKYLFETQANAIKGLEGHIEVMFQNYGKSMSRNQISQLVDTLNILIMQGYGNAAGNAKNTVSQEESETADRGIEE